jgi:hypothetical protein
LKRRRVCFILKWSDMGKHADEDNLFAALTARSLNPEIRIVTKGIDVKSHNKMTYIF